MKEVFTELFNELLKTKKAESKEEAEQLKVELWEEIKYDQPLIRQIFLEVKRIWEYKTLPTLAFFIKIRNEIKYPKNIKIDDLHYPKNKECNCISCKILKRLEDNKCIYCGQIPDHDSWTCVKCHIKEKNF